MFRERRETALDWCVATDLSALLLKYSDHTGPCVNFTVTELQDGRPSNLLCRVRLSRGTGNTKQLLSRHVTAMPLTFRRTSQNFDKTAMLAPAIQHLYSNNLIYYNERVRT